MTYFNCINIIDKQPSVCIIKELLTSYLELPICRLMLNWNDVSETELHCEIRHTKNAQDVLSIHLNTLMEKILILESFREILILCGLLTII